MYRKNVALGVAAFLVTGANSDAQQSSITAQLALTTDQMSFVALPTAPPGILSAVPVGDLAQNGVYVLRNRFPVSFAMPPHKHGEWRVMTVLEGTLYFAFGETFDEASLKPFGPGSLIVEPKGVYHYFATKDQSVVVQFVAEGPLTSEF